MRVEKDWGHEEIIHNGDYCCKALIYRHRIASSLHYHTFKHETFVVVSGLFDIETGSAGGAPNDSILETRRLGAGDTVTLPPLTLHRLRCVQPGSIIEASTHDDPQDCVRLIISEKPASL